MQMNNMRMASIMNGPIILLTFRVSGGEVDAVAALVSCVIAFCPFLFHPFIHSSIHSPIHSFTPPFIRPPIRNHATLCLDYVDLGYAATGTREARSASAKASISL